MLTHIWPLSKYKISDIFFIDPAKLAATITMAIKTIIVNEEEVSNALSLGSKREMKKVRNPFLTV